MPAMLLRGCRYARSGYESITADIHISDGQIAAIYPHTTAVTPPNFTHIDLSGFFVMPGLINAHDHLQFSLHPRLGNPPYGNYVEWGDDIHSTNSTVIARHNAVPRDVRLWWGGLRNLLCGVTTVCHHDRLWTELKRSDFPVRVVQRFGWTHSMKLGGDLCRAYAETPAGAPFILHAAEGIDGLAKEELLALDRIGLLRANTVLVHGLAIDCAGAALVQQRKASLIVCPSSNQFLFEHLPDIRSLRVIEQIALGNDSPLTAAGDLLDELRYAIRHCGIAKREAYDMVTLTAASVLRLPNGTGTVRCGGVGDVIAMRDTGNDAAERICSLSMKDIELVMIKGHIQLASDEVCRRLPKQLSRGLEPLWVNEHLRWLRAPVQSLLLEAERVLGPGLVRMSGRRLGVAEMALSRDKQETSAMQRVET